MTHGYTIRYFADDDFPQAAKDAAPAFLFVETNEGLVLFLKARSVCPAVLEEAWAAYREIETPRPHVPAQRAPLLRAVLGAGVLAASCAEGAAMLTNAHGAIPGII